LEIRAVDDQDTRDPSPAFADFSFTNRPPSVTIIGAPRPPTMPDGSGGDSTYASATFEWRTTDPDGDLNRVTYRVWLIGSEDRTRIVTGRTYTIPSADFLNASGQLQTGVRSVVVEPIDDGGLVGTADTASWYVRAPSAASNTHGRLLIVDDSPSARQGDAATDQFFGDAAARNLPPGTWSVLRLQFNRAFRSARDVEQTFALFDAVVWYRGDSERFEEVGSSPTTTNPLRDYQDGIGAYLDAGGNFLLEGRYLFRNTEVSGVTLGYLNPDAATRYLGSDGLVEHGPTGSPTESPTVWGINQARVLRFKSPDGGTVYEDSLRFAAARSGLFCFAVRDTNDVALWARTGQLSQGNTEDLAVGVNVAQPSGGRAVVLAIPIRVANGYASVPRILDKIFASLGLTP
jgi:hypothetical protein